MEAIRMFVWRQLFIGQSSPHNAMIWATFLSAIKVQCIVYEMCNVMYTAKRENWLDEQTRFVNFVYIHEHTYLCCVDCNVLERKFEHRNCTHEKIKLFEAEIF